MFKCLLLFNTCIIPSTSNSIFHTLGLNPQPCRNRVPVTNQKLLERVKWLTSSRFCRQGLGWRHSYGEKRPMAYSMRDSSRKAARDSSQMSTARGPMKVKSVDALSVGTWRLNLLEKKVDRVIKGLTGGWSSNIMNQTHDKQFKDLNLQFIVMTMTPRWLWRRKLGPNFGNFCFNISLMVGLSQTLHDSPYKKANCFFI